MLNVNGLCVSTVPSSAWLHQTGPFDEPDGSRADRGQNELFRRSMSQEVTPHISESVSPGTSDYLQRYLSSFDSRSQRSICWTPKKM